MLNLSFSEKTFPNIQPEPYLAFSSHPVSCSLGEKIDPHIATSSFQIVVESESLPLASFSPDKAITGESCD